MQSEDPDLIQHPWKIKDISKEGSKLYQIQDQKDIELFSEKIVIVNYEENEELKKLANSDGNLTLRNILNDYFRQQPKLAKENTLKNTLAEFGTYSDLNLLKVEKFVGVNSFTSEKFNIQICKFISNETTQILLKIDNISLEEKVEQLEEWDQKKDQILFNITHDLKTPLNAIMQMVLEAKETKNEDNRNELLSFASCNSELLFSLINDILDFAQLKQKKLKIVLQETNLLEVLESVLQIMRIQTDLKQIDLRLINQIQYEDEMIYTDSRRLKQILINLIGNAVKFTTTGYIQITLSKLKTQNLYKFEIQDTGTGIKPEIISNLCQPFQTFGNEKFKNSTGVGLGLCFCKQIVGLLGPFEELFIDSIYGKGTKFGFIVEDKNQAYTREISPRKNKQGDLSIIYQEQLSKEPERKESCIKEYFLPFSENCTMADLDEFNISFEKPNKQFQNYLNHVPPQNNQTILKEIEDPDQEKINLNVLIVDDSLFNIIVLKQQLSKLKKYNFTLQQGYNGQMAVDIFKRYNKTSSNDNIQIIFMDCNMPIMDGYKASEEIKDLIKMENYVETIITALSAQILDNAQVSFDYILTKPCPLSELSKFLINISSK